MLPDRVRASIEEALEWLDEISELSEILNLALEQIEQNPDRLISRLNFLITECESSLHLIQSEARADLASALVAIDRHEAAMQPARPAGKPRSNGKLEIVAIDSLPSVNQPT